MSYEFHKNTCPIFIAKYMGWAASIPPQCNCKNQEAQPVIEDPAEQNMCDGCQ